MAESSKNIFGSPVPVFRVKDVGASIAYYLQALGFELRWRASEGFACVAREKCSIFLTSDNQSQPRMWVWIGVEDVRALHTQYVASGARIRNPRIISNGLWRCRSWTSMGTSCVSGRTRRKSNPWASGAMPTESPGGISAVGSMSAYSSDWTLRLSFTFCFSISSTLFTGLSERLISLSTRRRAASRRSSVIWFLSSSLVSWAIFHRIKKLRLWAGARMKESCGFIAQRSRNIDRPRKLYGFPRHRPGPVFRHDSASRFACRVDPSAVGRLPVSGLACDLAIDRFAAVKTAAHSGSAFRLP
jgi:hypothetical protein